MKKQKQIWRFSLFLIGFILFFTSSCKKDDSSGNPIQNNATVQDALSAAGFTTYDGITPPKLDGIYSTTTMKCYNASINLKNFIGYNMTTICKFYGQNSSGDISFSEQISSNLFASGKGCYITGSDQNFTVWMENSLSNGAATAFVLSGTLDLATGNLLNCKSVTIYTIASSNYKVGDWYAHSGWIKKNGAGTTNCPCSSYRLGSTAFYTHYTATQRIFGVGYETQLIQSDCLRGSITYSFSNNLPSLSANLQDYNQNYKLRGYKEFGVPNKKVSMTITAKLNLLDGTICTHTITISD